MPAYPEQVPSGNGKLERRDDLYAVPESSRSAATGAVTVIVDDAQVAFAVYRGNPPKNRSQEDVRPVYSAGSNGPLAIATGRVFVRLVEGVNPEDRRSEFAAAGFEIEQTLSYAPNAAWLRPASGGAARALPGLATLKKLDDVEHVEPQLLFDRQFK